jgi:DNA-directed RNA polymerase III subunit RPC4
MTASGPFAMGPSAMSGSSSSRSALRASTANTPSAGPSTSKATSEIINTTPKSHLSKSKSKDEENEFYQEEYSDPEDGVEIIDMSLIKDMDWSAPDVLKRNLKSRSKLKKEVKESKMKEGKVIHSLAV